jgi:hypothetical protein
MEVIMVKKDISSEKWREYEWIIPETGKPRCVRIMNPIALYYEKGSSCHVVTAKARPTQTVIEDAIVAYCVPSVGRYGCMLTWIADDPKEDSVSFVSASRYESERNE